MDIILYTTKCPLCLRLEKVLIDKKIKYKTFSDVEKMIKLGLKNVPVLQVNGKIMNLKEAIDWLDKL